MQQDRLFFDQAVREFTKAFNNKDEDFMWFWLSRMFEIRERLQRSNQSPFADDTNPPSPPD